MTRQKGAIPPEDGCLAQWHYLAIKPGGITNRNKSSTKNCLFQVKDEGFKGEQNTWLHSAMNKDLAMCFICCENRKKYNQNFFQKILINHYK
jgi:hypothetical protein